MNLYLVIIGAIILICVEYHTLAKPHDDQHHNLDDSRDEDDDEDVHKSHHWAYDGPQGPQNWNKLGRNCTGKRQSPINILSGQTHLDKRLTGITFEGYNIIPPIQSVSLANNGHTIQMSISEDMNITITDGGLNKKYKFAQLHFHWGEHEDRENDEGSEHAINGKKFEMELHLVHYRETYKDITEAKMKPDGLAVLGILIEAGPRVHQGIDNIVKDLHKILFKDENIYLEEPFALEALLPSNRAHYYRYKGSLTTPDCFETVTWTVLAEPIKISKVQLGHFLDVQETYLGKLSKGLKSNFRPLQEVHDRIIYHSNHASALYKDQTQNIIIITAGYLIILKTLL